MTLTFLHPQIGEENRKDILRIQGLRDITEGVDSSTSNTFLVRSKLVLRPTYDALMFVMHH